MKAKNQEPISLVKPLVLFFVYWFLIRATFKYVVAYFEFEYTFGSTIWLTMAAALLAIQGTIKSERRLLSLGEKVKFAFISVGGIAALELLVLLASGAEIEQNALLFAMAVVVFLNFCGVWLGISTFASKVFHKELDTACR